MEKIIITIILVNIEITLIQTIIFEMKTWFNFFSISLQKKHFVTENFPIPP